MNIVSAPSALQSLDLKIKQEVVIGSLRTEKTEAVHCFKVLQFWVIVGKSQGVCALDRKGMVITKLLTELSCLNQLTDPSGTSPAETSFAGEAEGWTVPLL